jgi:Leucine-rich repeat (LRR) protein
MRAFATPSSTRPLFATPSNNLSALPEDAADLKHLRVLRLKYNAFKRLPAVAAGLPALSVLELAGNQISRLDAAVVAALTGLRELDLSGNALAELPPAVGRLSKMEALHLENNRWAQPLDQGTL